MKRIALDMDDVLADTLAALLVWFRERHGYAWSRSDLVGKRLFDEVVTAEQVAEVHAMMEEGSFFADLPVMPGAVEVVRALSARYEVFVASAATEFPGSFTPKYRWLARHFPFIPATHVVFCGDKGIVAADYLVDDSVKQLRSFRGQGVLFDAPQNAGETRFPRVSSWEDVARFFLGER